MRQLWSHAGCQPQTAPQLHTHLTSSPWLVWSHPFLPYGFLLSISHIRSSALTNQRDFPTLCQQHQCSCSSEVHEMSLIPENLQERNYIQLNNNNNKNGGGCHSPRVSCSWRHALSVPQMAQCVCKQITWVANWNRSYLKYSHSQCKLGKLMLRLTSILPPLSLSGSST